MSVSVQVLGRLDDALSTRADGRRPKSAKARNRGRECTRRCGHAYGDLIASTVTQEEVRGRYGCDVGGQAGRISVKKGGKATAVVVERRDRLCGLVAGG